MQIKHLGMKISVAALFCVALLTYGFYWKGISQLHSSIVNLLEVSNHLKDGETFHSAIHYMLINTQNYVRSRGLPEFRKNYLDQLSIASQAIVKLQRHAVYAASNKKDNLIKEYTLGLTKEFLIYQKELESIYQMFPNETQKHLGIAQELFDGIFKDYYLWLHDHHSNLQNKLKKSTSDTWRVRTQFFIIQLFIAITVGVLIIVYLDRVFLKIYSLTEHLALRDRLTGLHNRVALDKLIKDEDSLGNRDRRRYSLIMIDIDHFKMFNDTYGHQAGDQILAQVSAILNRNIRGQDCVFRYGGEEFLVYLAGEDAQGALLAAEKLRKAIEQQLFKLKDIETPQRVTVSLGVACQPLDGKNFNTVLHNADIRLYTAKDAGRNQVIGPS